MYTNDREIFKQGVDIFRKTYFTDATTRFFKNPWWHSVVLESLRMEINDTWQRYIEIQFLIYKATCNLIVHVYESTWYVYDNKQQHIAWVIIKSWYPRWHKLIPPSIDRTNYLGLGLHILSNLSMSLCNYFIFTEWKIWDISYFFYL